MRHFRAKLRIRHLEIVRMVADRGNVSKAAAELHITQSGLSRALAEIEEIVGGALFERTAKGMVTTPLGQSLCRHASVLLGAVDKAEADLQAVLHGELGQLSIGCFSFFSGWPLADAVRAFGLTYPRVAVSIQTGTHERLIDALDTGALDVLVSRAPPDLDMRLYRTLVLGRDAVVLVAAQEHPLATRASITLADCVAFPWITALQGSRVRGEIEQRLQAENLPLPTMVGALSLEFGLDTLADAHHLFTLPGQVAAVLQRRGRLRVLPVPLGLRPMRLAVIWRRDRSSTRQARAFCSLLAQVLADASP
jgi:DNA-binding transcriptional LysR family regulator